MAADHADKTEFARWLARNTLSNPFEAWRSAKPGKSGEIAFRAVAGDPALLALLDPTTAASLSEHAEQVAVGLLAEGLVPASGLALAVSVVLDRIARWRASTPGAATTALRAICVARDGGADGDLVAGLPSRPRSSSEWERAKANFPQLDERTGAAVTASLLEIGPAGLARLEVHAADVYAVIGARFAARRQRGIYKRGLDRHGCIRAVGIVGDWAVSQGRPALHIGPEVRTSDGAELAMSLARDAMACAQLSVDVPEKAIATHPEVWDEAIERHAYVLMALQPSLLRMLDLETVHAVASAAARLAADVLSPSSWRVAPRIASYLEPASPAAVLRLASKLLPGGVAPREELRLQRRTNQWPYQA